MFKNIFPNKKLQKKITTIIAAAVILITAAVNLHSDYKNFVKAREAMVQTDGLFSAHFIDVGQGDSTLLRSPDGRFMLIDCGTTDSGEYLVKYLKDVGVESLEYLLITHPHEDHYGGASAVIQNFPVENFIIHKDFDETYPYDKFIKMLNNNKFGTDTEIIRTKINDRFEFADCAEFVIISPEKVDYDDYNESSLSLKVVFGSTSFLFTGDAEKGLEREMLANGYNLNADVFQVGHHGSSTSNTRSFVEAISPEYAVISCAKDNDYGHPHKETMETLNDLDIEILRTDTLSDIIIVSDGTVTEYSEDSSLKTANENNNSGSGNMLFEYIKSLMKRFAA